MNVLFVFVQNAGRSQIASALFDQAGAGTHASRSVGSNPVEHVHAEVVAAMRELEIDPSDRVPRKLDRADAEWADVVVTMGCGDACPYIPGKRYSDWQLDDSPVRSFVLTPAARRARDWLPQPSAAVLPIPGRRHVR